MSSAVSSHDVPPARAWLALSVLTLPTALLALDMSVLYLALPHLAGALAANAAQQLWILDIYPLLLAGFLVPMAGLGDRIGRRRLLLTGAATFAALSVVAAFSPTAEVLIAARAALGIAGATLMPATLALISAMFANANHRRVAIAVWTSAFMTGFALGPLLGGALLQVFWWGTVFLLAVPVMVLLLGLGPALLPEHRPQQAQRLDLPSAALFLAGTTSALYALKQLATSGLTWVFPTTLALGALSLVVFVHRQYRTPAPLLDLRMLTRRTPGTALLLLVCGPALVSGITMFVPQHLQLAHNLPPVWAGALVVPAAAGLITGALLAPPAARRLTPGSVVAAGLVVSGVGFTIIAHGVTLSPGWVVAGLVAVYLGSGPFDALGTDLVVGSVPPERTASAGAASETVTELGTAVGIAGLGSLGSVVYGHRLAETLPPGLPDHVSVAAQESLSSAVAAAAQLPDEHGGAVRHAAAQAHAAGVQTAAIGCAVIAAVLAVLALWLLRRADHPQS